MADRSNSVFLSIIRTFFSSIFGVIGVAIGLIVLIVVFVAIFGSNKEMSTDFNYVQMPDEHGLRAPLGPSSPVVLWVSISGTIGTENLNAEQIANQLIESREGMLKNRVKAVLLHVNTPGGTVIDADSIYNSIKMYKAQFNVPVYAFVDGLCASGGMYVACASDKIYASDVSVVGSVGVYGRFFNVVDLMDKVGVNCMTLKAGKDKDEMSPFHKWEPGEEVNDQAIVDFYYGHFVDIVTAARPISKENLTQNYGAKVFVASMAQALGYIDEVTPTYNQALADLVKKAEIQQPYEVIQLKTSNWLDGLWKSESPIITGKIVHKLDFGKHFPLEFANQYLYYYHP